MKVSVSTIPLNELDVDLLIVPIVSGDSDAIREALRGAANPEALKDFTGKKGSSFVAYPTDGGAPRVVLVGLGEEPVSLSTLRDAAAVGAGIVRKTQLDTVGISMPVVVVDFEEAAQAIVLGYRTGLYQFEAYKTKKEDHVRLPQRLVMHTATGDKAVRRGAERGKVVAESVIAARDLVNLSPDEKTATLLAKAIERSAKKYGYTASVWDKKLIEEEGMGGLLAVNRGSTEPPTLTVMEWRPDSAPNDNPIVLIGKGVVFDTGGLSLKPTKNSMDAMKSDMAGAAAVVGTMEAIARLNLPLYVVALVPATDNRPGENAYVPGDVVRMHSGATVEVLNTDAEGRMLLADALSYAKTYNPVLVIDLATLTGAAVVALGEKVAAVMTNETDGAAERLKAMVEAGERSGDRVHPLPMFAEYGEQIKSDVADMKNVGGREAGTITAAKFLEHFVDYPWVHVDIAGPAFLRSANSYRGVGGTGFGVHLLTEFLRVYAAPRKT